MREKKMTMGDLLIRDLETLREYRMLGKVEELEKQLRELRHYKRLEKQGLLLRLPCKVGDTIYFVDFEENDFDKATIESIEFGRNGFMINSDYEIGTYLSAENLFLTKKEAEQALEKMISEVEHDCN